MLAAAQRPGDREAHGDYLQALAMGVWPLVRALLETPGSTDPTLLPDVSAWDALATDLAALGRPLPAPWRTGPADTDPEGAWGRLYVVRGAEAGVMVLARQIANSPAGQALPSRFASRLASRRGEWPALCSALGRLGDRAARRAAAVAHDDFRFALQTITAWEQDRTPILVA